MSLFFVRGKRSGTKKSTSGKRTFVPCLEVLESRDLLSTFTVTNTSSGPSTSGSLPWAVQQANSTSGLNYINFDISGSGSQIININSTLSLNNQVVINGTTQPGYNGTPLISVQGNSGVPSLFSLGAGSSGSTIEGLDLYDYAAGNAVTITNSTSGNYIQNNWMGFYRDPSTGHVSLNSSLGGQFSSTGAVGIQSSNNTIRGNVIDGVYNGIRMGEDPAAAWSGTVYSGNSITGNFIGTDPSGTTSKGYGNLESGVFLGAGCQGNFIGPSNVLSGNAVHGVELFAPSDKGNVIFGNKIGTDVTGSYAIPNGDGVLITDGANGNAIGGPSGGNLISGNTLLAISLGLAGYGVGNNNWVQYNIIGLNASQTAAIGPGQFGISINSGSSGNHVLSNVVAGASLSGIILANTQSNTIKGNWIGINGAGFGFPNGHFGVELQAGANFNTVVQNSIGAEGIAPIYVDPGDIGNVISNTLTSITAETQQISLDFITLLAAIERGNISLAFQELGDLISLWISVILHSL